MPKVHFLNVKPGDCTVIQHASGRVSMVDICGGNKVRTTVESARADAFDQRPRGNFQMCQRTTNPLDYLAGLMIGGIHRFILTHPDSDHMDGFDALCDSHTVHNFWDSGARREKPSFGGGQWLEDDWDRYELIRDGRSNETKSISVLSGKAFKYANQNESGEGGGDGLHILAPDEALLNDPDLSDDVNEGSYIILYRSIGGKILLPGDAHDAGWEYVLDNSAEDVRDCAFMLAPHHGRDSGRNYDFLDTVRPRLTLLGCAPSEYIDYSQWTRRGLAYVTSNQVGNLVLDITSIKIDVYIENDRYAKQCGADLTIRNDQGYVWVGQL